MWVFGGTAMGGPVEAAAGGRVCGFCGVMRGAGGGRVLFADGLREARRAGGWLSVGETGGSVSQRARGAS
jgi:hypothetical protein